MSPNRTNAVLRITGAILIASGLVASPVFAQGSAVITGTVVAADSKNPVSDVVVTATSPQLQGEQVVVTDATGLYRIPQLPSGVYTLRYEKEGFKPFSRDGITVRQDVTVRVNIDLLPEALTEDIVVVGRPPTIDVGSTTTGVNVSSDFIKNIAVVNPGARGGAARSFESLAVIAPGAHADAYGVSISGTTSPENQYLIDGVSVNDPGFGINATPLTVEFVSEVNVISGGYLPEYGRATGGVMSVVTKSGSNEFHGSVFGNITPGALQGDVADCDLSATGWFGHFNCGRTIQRVGQTINTEERLWNLGDFGIEVGGPIMKDKLWFFVGFAPSYTRNRLTRSLRGQQTEMRQFGANQVETVLRDAQGNPLLTDVLEGSTKTYFADQSTYQYLGKLTYLINQDHNVSVSVYGTPTSSGGQNEFGIDPRTGATEVANIIGPIESIATNYISNSLDVSAKLASSFMDKKLLFDLSLGYHNQVALNNPYDGSDVGTDTGLSGVPAIQWRTAGTATAARAGVGVNGTTTRDATQFYPLSYFEALSGEAATYCEGPTTDPRRNVTGVAVPAAGLAGLSPGAVRCPVSGYVTGGPGFLNDTKFQRYQGKGVLTYLLNAAGHHVLKAGIDIESATMDNTRAYSGDIFYRANQNFTFGLPAYQGRGTGSPSQWTELRAYGVARGPDQLEYLNGLHHVSTSTTMGGFVQDSWNVLDLLTLNLGVRYDQQQMFAQNVDGTTNAVLNLGNQWSPRIGVIYDFTGSGRSKLFANYARYFENAVLDMIDRGFPTGEPGTQAIRFAPLGCTPWDITVDDPGSRDTCLDSSSALGPLFLPDDPNQYFVSFGDEATAVDPELQPQSSDELVVGGEYEVFQDARAGLTYTKRYMVNVIEDVSLDEATTYILANPGAEGTVGAAFPKGQRDYDAVTVYLNKNFSDLWLAQISYTWSRLYGNYAGLFRPETGQLDPNINSTFDLISLLENGTGFLPGDRTHSVKAFAAKEFVFGGNMSMNLGLTFTSRSGNSLNAYGSHEIYGANEVLMVPRGTAGRMPWVHNVDTHIGFNYKLSKDSMVTLSADVFNLFNFQQEVGRDQTYTTSTVLPIRNGTVQQLRDGGLLDVNGAPVVVNPNWGRTTVYQAARSVRFGARVTF